MCQYSLILGNSDQHVGSMARKLTDEETILKAGAQGRAIRDIARAHALTEAAVKSIIDAKADDALSGAQLRRELLFEVMRLRSLGQKYYERGMASDGETNSGLLLSRPPSAWRRSWE
jgi:hypothetical protein